MLSEKAAKIMAILVNNDKCPITVRQISAMLEISERSVSTYLKEVYEYCRKKGIEVTNKPGLGILVSVGTQKQAVLSELAVSEKPYYTSEYRVNYIISLLLNNWTTYTIALFADDLNVSKTTVENDLLEAEAWLLKYGIRVLRKVGAGICLEGEELNIRKAIVAINRWFFKPSPRLPKGPGDYRLGEATLLRLAGTYRNCDIGYYIDIIRRADRMGKRQLTDRGFEAMLEYLIVTHRRIQLGHIMPAGFWQDNPHDRINIEDCTAVYAEELKLPEGEREYVELLMCCMEYQNSPTRVEELFENPLPDILSVTEQVIQYVSNIIGVDFSRDILLKKTLYYYNRSALLRIKYGIEMQNPFMEDVKKTYPAIFSACFAASSIYYKAAGQYPSENEISHLSLLIGGAVVRSDKKINAVIICAAGIGTSQIVARKIEDRLPQINVILTLSFTQLPELSALNPQLIITTIPDIRCDYPTVTISPVLSDEDIRKINRACSAIYTKARGAKEHGGGNMLDLLHDRLIFLDYDGLSKEKLLRFMAERLSEEGYVSEGFLADVMERERIGSTALGSGVAIPHGVSGLVRRPAICLMRLRQSINWSGEPVNLIFMLALNFEDISSTKLFFKAFYHLTGNTGTIQLLTQAGSAEEIKRIIAERCV